MSYQETSRVAFQEIEHKIGEKQKIVYDCLKDLESANNTIIAFKLGWRINTVTPRINELRKMGLVVMDCKRMCPITKKMTLFWRIA